MRALVTGGQSWAETWQNIRGTVVDRLFDLAFSPAWDALFANLESYFSFAGSGGGGGSGGGLPGNLLGTATGWVGNILGGEDYAPRIVVNLSFLCWRIAEMLGLNFNDTFCPGWAGWK